MTHVKGIETQEPGIGFRESGVRLSIPDPDPRSPIPGSKGHDT